jgi:hypothetical protein
MTGSGNSDAHRAMHGKMAAAAGKPKSTFGWQLLTRYP